MLFHLIPWASNCQPVLFCPPVPLPCLEEVFPESHIYPVLDLMVSERTGEALLTATPDTTAKFNRIRFQLSAGQCPNKRLQELWTQYGEDDFELRVVQCLEYEDPTENHADELETLCELCLVENPQAKRL